MRIIAGQFKGPAARGARTGTGCGRPPTACARRSSIFWARRFRGAARARRVCRHGRAGARGAEPRRRARDVRRARPARDKAVARRRTFGAAARKNACAIVTAAISSAGDVGAGAASTFDWSCSIRRMMSVIWTRRCSRGWQRWRRGRLVLEHSRRRASPETPRAACAARVVTAGDSALSFYRRAERRGR